MSTEWNLLSFCWLLYMFNISWLLLVSLLSPFLCFAYQFQFLIKNRCSSIWTCIWLVHCCFDCIDVIHSQTEFVPLNNKLADVFLKNKHIESIRFDSMHTFCIDYGFCGFGMATNWILNTTHTTHENVSAAKTWQSEIWRQHKYRTSSNTKGIAKFHPIIHLKKNDYVLTANSKRPILTLYDPKADDVNSWRRSTLHYGYNNMLDKNRSRTLPLDFIYFLFIFV